MNPTLHRHLRQLCLLRLIAVLGQSLAVLGVTRLLDIPLETGRLWLVIGAQALAAGLTGLRLRLAHPVTEKELFAQILLDVGALGAMLYLTGGSTNPFTSLFILQVMIAATILPRRYVWAVAATAVALYTALMRWNVEVPYFHSHHLGEYFNMHVHGMWLSFLLLAGLVAWFVADMNARLRRQSRLLAEAEQLAALGGFAAGAAHELGTPLATIAVIAGERARRAATQEERKEAETLKEQARRCKTILSRIALAAGAMRAESGEVMALDAFLRRVAAHWRILRPEAALAFTAQGPLPAPRIVAERSLEQALANLLNNAADAAREVTMEASWTAESLRVAIRDRGAGISAEALRALDAPVASTKEGGMGMGLYLAGTILKRLGGGLALTAPAEGGTLAEVTLPLKSIAL